MTQSLYKITLLMTQIITLDQYNSVIIIGHWLGGWVGGGGP